MVAVGMVRRVMSDKLSVARVCTCVRVRLCACALVSRVLVRIKLKLDTFTI